MTRARAVAALAVGCALAAAAAANGPVLARQPGNEVRFKELARLLRQRRVRLAPGAGAPGWARVVDNVLGTFVLVVALVLAALALWLLGTGLTRVVRLRLANGAWRLHPADYADDDRSDEDVATALRRRVRQELTALAADLDTAPDPREAVIACYVRMEAALAAAGSARRATESPLELVARVLAEQDVPEADVRRLTTLFEEARFSSHPVTDHMRRDARRSLDAVADALAVTA